MKKINCRSGKKGFTLIELLIVIALLGALAVGLLAAIDPFEQLKKGRDTSMRNTVSEFYDAALRYYATKAQFPWGTSGISGTLSSNTNTNDLNNMSDSLSALVTQGELKDKFQDLAGTGNLAKIYVTSTDATHVSVCFSPESKSFQGDLNTIYSMNGGSGDNCKSTAGASGSDCFFCVQ